MELQDEIKELEEISSNGLKNLLALLLGFGSIDIIGGIAAIYDRSLLPSYLGFLWKTLSLAALISVILFARIINAQIKLKKLRKKANIENAYNQLFEKATAGRDFNEVGMMAEYQKILDNYEKDFFTSNDKLLRYVRYVRYYFENKNIIFIQGNTPNVLIHYETINYEKTASVMFCSWHEENDEITEQEVKVTNAIFDRDYAKNSKGYIVFGQFMTPTKYYTQSAKDYTKSIKDKIIPLRIPYDPTYPKIKCVAYKDGKKIYYIPSMTMYDDVYVFVSNGDFYAKTILEAEAAGYRAAFYTPEEYMKLVKEEENNC